MRSAIQRLLGSTPEQNVIGTFSDNGRVIRNQDGTLQAVSAGGATNDPAINLTSKAWLANQQITWKSLLDHYHANSDYYLSEMEAADKSGPGTLELSPSMTIPSPPPPPPPRCPEGDPGRSP